MDKISVIIPIYNIEKYLIKSIESVIVQTYKNLEIILVNDGSTDNSLKICEKYLAKDKRVKLINKENGGLSDARNKGLDSATGEYLFFLDGDDYLEITALELLYNTIKSEKSDICICNLNYVNENEEIILEKANSFFLNKGNYTEENKFKLIENCVVWNKLYKENIFKDLRFAYGKQHEDEFIIHHICDKAKKISVIEDRLHNYVQREDSIMGRKVNIKNLDGVEAFLERTEIFIKKELYLEANTSLRMARKSIKNYENTLEKTIEIKERISGLKKMYIKIMYKLLFKCKLQRKNFKFYF